MSRHRAPYDWRAMLLDWLHSGSEGTGRHGRYVVVELPRIVVR